jgi:iron(III) transport system permease protein
MTALGHIARSRGGSLLGHLRLDRWSAFALATAGLVAVPVVVVFGFVLVPATDVWHHLAATVLPRYLANTLWLIAGVSVAVFLTGVSTAWLVTMCQFPGRRVFEWMLLLPLAMPAYAVAYAYAGTFDFAGPVQTALRDAFGWTRNDYWFPQVRSLGGAFMMLGLVTYPYVYMLARAAFIEQSVCVLEISRTLGRGPWAVFFRVALPLARPAIVTGIALALMETLSDFGTVQYFAVDTFTTGIFRTWFGFGDPAAAAQLAAILMVFVFVVLLVERRSRGMARYHHTSIRYRPLPRFRLTGFRAAVATVSCVAPVVFGFMLPAAILASWSYQSFDDSLAAGFLRLSAHSVVLSAVAAMIAVVVAVILAYGIRIGRSPLSLYGARIAAMGYAVPGSVIAVGVMVPFAAIDNAFDAWMRDTFGVSTGLILSGTLAALLFAYLVRFLAISFNTVEASLAKITPNMDCAARTLGARPVETLRRVHAPLMWSSLLTAALLVFVDVMKELPATLIMRPFDFNTLAVRTFELASDERLSEAALPALAIVGVGIGPVLILSAAIARGRPGQGGGAR